ncbi:hypothetical protein NUW54_g10670 [Trametes sanguinea]|uniref:Uncharacterized protein n=1 Tax=Trametes sanguinea TaxID=158606 RepID=A0ACC1NUS9_9APHY|nr:hypothetical protein NUW54_g10670 [Trametes sanguinea]
MASNGHKPPGLLVSEHKARVQGGLRVLKRLVDAIPSTAPEGSADGPLARNFSDLDLDPEEGPYYALDRAWVRTFQVPENQLQALVCRGQYGLSWVHDCLMSFSELPGMEANNGLYLMAEKIDWLNRLVTQVLFKMYRGSGIDIEALLRAQAAVPIGSVSSTQAITSPGTQQAPGTKLNREPGEGEVLEPEGERAALSLAGGDLRLYRLALHHSNSAQLNIDWTISHSFDDRTEAPSHRPKTISAALAVGIEQPCADDNRLQAALRRASNPGVDVQREEIFFTIDRDDTNPHQKGGDGDIGVANSVSEEEQLARPVRLQPLCECVETS